MSGQRGELSRIQKVKVKKKRNEYVENRKQKQTIEDDRGINRSIISPDFAKNFIKTFIIE